jgi:cyclic pyranopterin phosphate synthase
LILNPDGKVGCCREKGTEHEVGNILNESIEEIWNGEKIRAWRREFLTGNIKTCKEDICNKACNKLHLNQALIPHIELDEYVKGPILRLSPDFNGKCNLQCPFCFVWKKPNKLYDSIEGFWDHLAEHVLPYTLQIDPLAGEPFIQDDLYKLIKLSAKISNENCKWSFTTNAQWYLSDKIKSYLELINIDSISVSLDSVDSKTYHKIRYPGQLNAALKTIDDLIAYKMEREEKGRGFKLLVNFTIQKENWNEVKQMISYCNDKDLHCFLQYVYLPDELSLNSFDEEKRLSILGRYLKDLSKDELMTAHRVITPLVNSLPEKKKLKFFKFLNLETSGFFARTKGL